MGDRCPAPSYRQERPCAAVSLDGRQGVDRAGLMLKNFVARLDDEELQHYHPTIRDHFKKRLLVFAKLSILIQTQMCFNFNVSLFELLNLQMQYEESVRGIFGRSDIDIDREVLSQIRKMLQSAQIHVLSAELGKQIIVLAKTALQWEADLTACIETKKANWWEYLACCVWRCLQVTRDGIVGIAYYLSLQTVITLSYPTLDGLSFFLKQVLLYQAGWKVGCYLNQGYPDYPSASIIDRIPQAPTRSTCAMLTTFAANMVIALYRGDYCRVPTWLVCHAVVSRYLMKRIEQQINVGIGEHPVLTALAVGTRPLQILLLTEVLYAPTFFVMGRLLAEHRLYSQLLKMLVERGGSQIDLKLYPSPMSFDFWTSCKRTASISYIQKNSLLEKYQCDIDGDRGYIRGQCQRVAEPIAVLPSYGAN